LIKGKFAAPRRVGRIEIRKASMKVGRETPAIVTGGASGLGAAAVKALTATGAKVSIFDLDIDIERRTDLAKHCGAMFLRVDVGDPQSVADGFKAAREVHGQERIAVNCAGIAPAELTVTKTGPPDFAIFEKAPIQQPNAVRSLSRASGSLRPNNASGPSHAPSVVAT
jgi:NAD(P)-dependent dehydrogenase (short-subunit alcohol dehydrogenase family)